MKHATSSGFPYYIELTGDSDLNQLFESDESLKFLSSFSEEQSTYRYAPGKWSIKQITGHITDHERIMTYRALRFSRKDATPLSGYDQDLLVENSRFDELPYSHLLKDLQRVRQATLSLIHALSAEQLALKGFAWKFELAVEEVLRATIGHEMHHIAVVKEKYLK